MGDDALDRRSAAESRTTSGPGRLPEAVGTWLWRGFPAGIDGLALTDVAAQGWTTADLKTPVAVLSRPALAHNQATVAAWAAGVGAELAPHVKTTMSPEIMRLQLDGGAWALTAANPWQARVMTASGAHRVVIANEVASPEELAALLREVETWVFVDSPESLAVVAEAGRRADAVVPVILDLGFEGGRTGVRTIEAALDVAAAATGSVRLAGYGLFEGILTGGRGAADIVKVRAGLDRAVAAIERVQAVHPVENPVVTGGGSMFPDLVAEVFGALAAKIGGRLVLRPGCSIVHDHGAYESSYQQSPWLDLQQALSLITTVLTVPQPGLAILDAGKRDLTLDGRTAPILAITRGNARIPHPEIAVGRSNDQHSYVEWDPANWDGLAAGDRVWLGVSHPCLTFQLWRAMPLLDGERVVGAARTFF